MGRTEPGLCPRLEVNPLPAYLTSQVSLYNRNEALEVMARLTATWAKVHRLGNCPG